MQLDGQGKVITGMYYNTAEFPTMNSALDRRNAIFIKADDVTDLVEKVAWASRNPERLEQIGKQARKDMESYFTAMKPGGKIYLQQFASL